MRSDSRLAPRCGRARDPAEHRAVRESAAAGVIEPEDAPDELARSEQARDRLAIGAQDSCLSIYLQTPKTEGDPAGHGVGLEWGRVKRIGPVALVDLQPRRAAAVLHVRVERDVRTHRSV